MDKKEIGQLIGTRREAAGMSQGMLAKNVGVSRPYISQIENGTKNASDEVLMRIFAILGIEYTELLDPNEEDPLTKDEHDALVGGMDIIGDLSKLVDGETLTKIMLAFTEHQNAIEAALNTIQDNPELRAPEGWFDLDKEDRRLVQRIINRLNRKGDEQAHG